MTSRDNIVEANITPQGRLILSKVFVLDTNKMPLNPVHPGHARKLLDSGKAAVFKRYPFTIVLKREVVSSNIEPLRLKLDPGSKVTGMAIVNDATGEVVFGAEIEHRGWLIKKRLDSRRCVRRGRRSRHCRYRPARFLNRRKPKGWLSPSLESRIANVMTWVRRLCHLCPISGISMELVKFDTQKMQNPEISGVEYQQGELQGYEVREYLLEKWGRKCAYCGKEGVPLEIEHIVPRARGGSDRVSNLTLACEPCNRKKGTSTAAEFGHPEVQSKAKRPLKDASAMNATRWELYRRLQATGLDMEAETGGRTKYNRTKQGLPKAHWIDAVCVGASTPILLNISAVKPLSIKAMGHGNRQMCCTDKYGFPNKHRTGVRSYQGFRTGDLVVATVPRGKHQGQHIGRVVIRMTGSFGVGMRDGIGWRHCKVIQRTDGYEYTGGALPLSPKGR
jgi:5-methylcytosine-specific restriction endonuclease McrA